MSSGLIKTNPISSKLISDGIFTDSKILDFTSFWYNLAIAAVSSSFINLAKWLPYSADAILKLASVKLARSRQLSIDFCKYSCPTTDFTKSSL